jgi:hypothetical protein
VLETERVTVLPAEPVAIDAGLKRQLVKAGRLLQAKFTAEVKVTPPTGAAENVYDAICPASTVTLELPVSVQVMFAPDPVTVSVSVGVAWVIVPSVPWIVKTNTAAEALPRVTLNGVPPAVGVNVRGLGVQIAGAPPVHDSVTVPLYPSIDVTAPFQLTFWLMPVVAGAGVMAMAKSGTGTVTFKPNVWVFAAGAPLAMAASVTVVGPPSAVPEVAVTVKVTVTGFAAVGLTEPDGENWHAVPLGRPEQLKVTDCVNIPDAVT